MVNHYTEIFNFVTYFTFYQVIKLNFIVYQIERRCKKCYPTILEDILQKYKNGKFHYQQKAIDDAKSKLISFSNEYYIELGNSLFLKDAKLQFVIQCVKEWETWKVEHKEKKRIFDICDNIINNGTVLHIVHSVFLRNNIIVTKCKIITIIEYFLKYFVMTKKLVLKILQNN